MYPRTILIAVAVSTLVPRVLSGQAVDVSVRAVDPTVASRIQDPDQPNNALLPGGSSAWTGQPMMSQQPSPGASAASRANQVASMAGASAWAPSTSAVWAGQSLMSQTPSLSGSTALPGSGSVSPSAPLQNSAGVSAWGRSSFAIASSLNASGAQGQLQKGMRWTTAAGLAKLNFLTPASVAEAERTDRSQNQLLEEAFSVEQNRSSASLNKLRQLKQAQSRSARLRLANPLQSKADASSAPHWGSDESSSRALDQQRHETGMLLKSGFGARSERRKRARAHGGSAQHAKEIR
jgi:hypothetical protein